MRLTLFDAQNNVVTELLDDSKLFGEYGPKNGYRIHIVDDDPYSISKGGGLENVGDVEKYRMSDEDYAKRPESYIRFKEEMRKKHPGWTISRGKEEALGEVDVGEERPEGLEIGGRCEVFPGGRRGCVMFVGREVKGLPEGWWVGVKYDEPVGKNDGRVKGERYFECEMGFGGFVRPSKVKVGDFPVEEEGFFSDGDEI